MIEINEDNVDDAFSYHAPKEGQPEKYKAIAEAGAAFAKVILANCPRSPLRIRALNMAFDTRMVANAAVATDHIK